MAEKFSVHIVEDDPVIRDCICHLLEDEGLSVKTYASALDFLAGIGPQASGCVITDLSMPGMSGIALLTSIAQRALPLSVVVISGHTDVSLAVQAIKKGAVDFIGKPFRCDELIAAVRLALARQSGNWDERSVAHEILTRLAMLSTREHEVLARVLTGQANEIIAFQLGLSLRTVETLLANLMAKMRAGNLSQLIAMSLIAEKHRA